MRKVFAAVLLAVALFSPFATGLSIPFSSHQVAANCIGIVPFQDGDWGKDFVLPDGTVIGGTKAIIAPLHGCTPNSYYQLWTHLKGPGYYVVLSVWENRKDGLPNSTIEEDKISWAAPVRYTKSDFIPGNDSYCTGVQIYKDNGKWVRWQFLGCLKTAIEAGSL